MPLGEFLKGILEAENTRFFAGELEDGEIIGMLSLITYNIPTGTKFWIEDVVIDDSHRNKGYGKDLILYAIRCAESIGARAIDLTSRPFRIAANQLNIDLGFVRRDSNVYRYLSR